MQTDSDALFEYLGRECKKMEHQLFKETDPDLYSKQMRWLQGYKHCLGKIEDFMYEEKEND
jgi:hypothetical protein